MNDLKNRIDGDIAKNLDGNKKTLDRVCADFFKILKNSDLEDIALKTGATIIGAQRLGLLFFGSEVIVDLEAGGIYYKEGSSDGKLENSKKLDVFSCAVILHYLINADGTKISGEWISYRELPDGMFYFRTIPGVLEPVRKKYKNSAEGLIKRIEGSGGHKSSDFKNGGVIYPFINFPILLIMDEESEEFDASLRILFDSNGSHYIKTDVIKMIVVYLARILVL
ncbi:MAG: DUF3786 domain-containing protein [Candidatus Humimicrobiaceae bacterium]